LLDDRERLVVVTHELPAEIVAVALEWIDVDAHERFGFLSRDLLDLDAAFLRVHQQRLLLAAVERDRQVVLLLDFRRALDPELADDVPADVETEDLGRLALRVGGILRELHAARFSAPSRQHLRLDDDAAAELLRGRTCLRRRRRESTLGDGDIEAPEELLPLVLVQVHGAW